MSRLPNWENRLALTLAQWRGRQFRWDADCARYLAAVTIAVTGEDPLADLRGQYRTKREALALLSQKPMASWLDDRFPRVPIALAQRGDIALAGDMHLGCVIGGEALFFTETGFLGPTPRSDWQGVWGVGRDG